MADAIRDFIYLDEERLRSCAAQLLEGIPESRVNEGGHEVGGAAKGEAGLLSFVKAHGEVDYRYHRSGSETSSLHHHVYTLFEQELDRQRFLREVDISFDHSQWARDSFADGEFVRVRGEVQLFDHARVIARIQALPKFVKALQGIASAAQRGDGAGSPQARNASQQFALMSNELKKFPLDQLGSMGQQLYDAGEFRVKVRPEGAPSGHIFVGQAHYDRLVNANVLAGGMYRSMGKLGWIVLGQVLSAENEAIVEPLPTGNVLEDGLEGMAIALDTVVHFGTDVAFPAQRIVPIAVYREIIPRPY